MSSFPAAARMRHPLLLPLAPRLVGTTSSHAFRCRRRRGGGHFHSSHAPRPVDDDDDYFDRRDGGDAACPPGRCIIPGPIPRIVVAMSGGVDSSVAAYLLKEARCDDRRSGTSNTRRDRRTRQRDGRNDDDDDDDGNGDDGIVEVLGLHMSNWNAMDEDADDYHDDIDDGDDHRRRSGRCSIFDDANDNTSQSNPDRRRRHADRESTTSTSSSSSSSHRAGGEGSSGRSRYGRTNNYCTSSEREYDDARSVANRLSIPLHRVSFTSEYWTTVFEPFIRGLDPAASSSSSNDRGSATARGEEREGMAMDIDDNSRRHRASIINTPNPDHGCNTHIKFGTMMEYARSRLRADYVATGHYARLWHRDHYATLLASLGKDGDGRVNDDIDDERKGRDFYRWMDETSRDVGECVLESISGLPEEEWILDPNDIDIDCGHSPMLIAGADARKDQSYFLSGVKWDAFRNVIFPLGHLAKSNDVDDDVDRVRHLRGMPSVRDIARDADIPTANKRDSMGICFIGERNFGNFVSQYLPHPAEPTCGASMSASASRRGGNFIDVDTGEVVGTHTGRAMHYTLGQGARISGVSSRYFVCGRGGGSDDRGGVGSFNADVYVCNSTHHPALYADELYVEYDSFNWIGFGGKGDAGLDRDLARGIPRPLREGHSVHVVARTRHLQPLAPCTVTWERNPTFEVTKSDSGGGRGRIVVRFANPIRAITPGQIVALYAGRDGLICLGGGPIGGRGATHFDRGISVSLSDLHPSGHNDLSLSHFKKMI